MKVKIISNLEDTYTTRLSKLQMLKTAFLDTGGSPDFAAFTMARVNVPARIIYITGAMFWQINEKDKITFASIRNDIAKLHIINKFDLMGCERNNFGRNEMESLRREYGIKMIGINTTGKITSEDIAKRGESMDKEAIIKFVNSWRQNVIADPENDHKLGQIKFLKKKTVELTKLVNELDSFVRKVPEGIGTTGRPKFGAEGSGHDDGVMSMLGNVHMIKVKVFKIFTGVGAVGAVHHDGSHVGDSVQPPIGRSIGKVRDSSYLGY